MDNKIYKYKNIIISIFILFIIICLTCFFYFKSYKTYTVSFDYDNGSNPIIVNVKNGSRIKKPETPVREGYEFAGWQLNGELYDFDIPIVESITLTATWNKIVDNVDDENEYFTIVFDTDGGSTIENQKIKSGELATVPTIPTKSGFEFVEWQLDGKAYDFKSPVTSNITLIANWKATKYTITFNSNGGSAVSSQTVDNGAKVTKPADPTRSGYTFVEWQLNGKAYDFKTPVTDNIVLVASWKANDGTQTTEKYTVTFDSNGGSAVSSQTIDSGGKAVKPTAPTRSGYTFVEWRLNGKSYNFNTAVTKNITLVAKWKEVAISGDGLINNKYFNIIENSMDNAANNTTGINNAIKYAYDNNIKSIKLKNGTYFIDAINDITISSTERKYAINLLSNVTLDLNNSTLKLKTNSYPRYMLLFVSDISGSSIINGTLIGDRETHTCSNGTLLEENGKCIGEAHPSHEWGACLYIINSNNILASNLDISKCTGDGVTITNSNSIDIKNNDIHYVRRNGISIISGEFLRILNNSIHDIQGSFHCIDIEADSLSQIYKDITISNNKLYNVLKNCITVFNRIYNFSVTNNYLSSYVSLTVKARKKLDLDSDLFPTNKDIDYIKSFYNINMAGNKVINVDDKEHGNYVVKVSDDTVNNFRYTPYKPVVGIYESEKKYTYNMSVGDKKTIVTKFNPSLTSYPSYQVLNYSSADNTIASVNTSGKITAKKKGTTQITVTATDYGPDPYTDVDNKIFTYTIVVNVE